MVVPLHPTSTSVWCLSTQHARQCGGRQGEGVGRQPKVKFFVQWGKGVARGVAAAIYVSARGGSARAAAASFHASDAVGALARTSRAVEGSLPTACGTPVTQKVSYEDPREGKVRSPFVDGAICRSSGAVAWAAGTPFEGNAPFCMVYVYRSAAAAAAVAWRWGRTHACRPNTGTEAFEIRPRYALSPERTLHWHMG